MIEPIRSLSVEVVPQAVISLPVEKIVGRRADITRGVDDLDSFEGASFKLNREIEIAIRHYKGHPKNTATIYIDHREANIERITQLVLQIMQEFHLPKAALQWQRRDDPEL